MNAPMKTVEQEPDALLVFEDAESARLSPLGPSGAGQEVRLESEVDGHHRQGGWALLAPAATPASCAVTAARCRSA